MSAQIHWHEGLFLQPHHLQFLQRSVFSSIWAQRNYTMPFSYGVINARLSTDDLAAHRVKFDELHIAMRGGAVFQFPENAELPALDIREAFQNPENASGFTVGLALPLWHASGQNSIPYQGEKAGKWERILYQVKEINAPDENTGVNPQPVQVRKFNGCLMIHKPGEELHDVEFLPLLRVVRDVAGEMAGRPAEDPRYVPPTLLLSSSPVLFILVRELTSQVCSTREQLAEQLASSQLDLRTLQGAQFENLGRLRCLARAAALLPSLIDDSTYLSGCAGRVPLFDIYLMLRDLLAELTALYPGRGVEDPLPYDHDDPYPPFADLDLKIRSFLGTIIQARYRKIDFHFDPQKRWYIGDLNSAFFKDATGFYLCVETTSMDPTSVARLVEHPDQFKLMPVSFGPRALRGLVLHEQRTHPDLPLKSGRYFFRVNTQDSDRIWDFFMRDPEGVVKFEAQDFSRFRLSLYATIPASDG